MPSAMAEPLHLGHPARAGVVAYPNGAVAMFRAGPGDEHPVAAPVTHAAQQSHAVEAAFQPAIRPPPAQATAPSVPAVAPSQAFHFGDPALTGVVANPYRPVAAVAPMGDENLVAAPVIDPAPQAHAIKAAVQLPVCAAPALAMASAMPAVAAVIAAIRGQSQMPGQTAVPGRQAEREFGRFRRSGGRGGQPGRERGKKNKRLHIELPLRVSSLRVMENSLPNRL